MGAKGSEATRAMFQGLILGKGPNKSECCQEWGGGINGSEQSFSFPNPLLQHLCMGEPCVSRLLGKDGVDPCIRGLLAVTLLLLFPTVIHLFLLRLLARGLLATFPPTSLSLCGSFLLRFDKLQRCCLQEVVSEHLPPAIALWSCLTNIPTLPLTSNTTGRGR